MDLLSPKETKTTNPQRFAGDEKIPQQNKPRLGSFHQQKWAFNPAMGRISAIFHQK